MELILIRHGLSEGNIARVFQGQSEWPLSETGRAQARAAHERLGGFDPDIVFSSPLSRARETASIVFPGAETIEDPRLMEVSFGELSGLTFDEAEAKCPGMMARWLAEREHFRVPGGESAEDVYVRTGEALHDFFRVTAERKTERAAIVTHSLTMGCLMANLLGCPVEFASKLMIGNACAAWFYVDTDGTAVLKGLENAAWFREDKGDTQCGKY